MRLCWLWHLICSDLCKVPNNIIQLTANDHNADGEDLLWVGVWRYITEPYARQTAQGEVKCSDVLVFDWWPRGRVIVVVRLSQLFSQVVQPTSLRVRPFDEANGVPNAGKPMGDEHKGAHKQKEDSSPILRISVQLSCYTDQSQQPSCFQQTG